MFEILYFWICKRSITKPNLMMQGSYDVLVNEYVVNEPLNKEVREAYDAVLIQQAVEYIEYAQKLGAEAIPISRKRRMRKGTKVYFKLKFKDNESRTKFENVIKTE